MTSDDFARAVKLYASDAAARITLSNLKSPPGRRPTPEYIRRSEWFGKLSLSDQEILTEIIQEAAENAAFGLLAIIDGSRVVEDTPAKGDFELHYSREDQRILL